MASTPPPPPLNIPVSALPHLVADSRHPLLQLPHPLSEAAGAKLAGSCRPEPTEPALVVAVTNGHRIFC